MRVLRFNRAVGDGYRLGLPENFYADVHIAGRCAANEIAADLRESPACLRQMGLNHTTVCELAGLNFERA
jgi:hypothetical protein